MTTYKNESARTRAVCADWRALGGFAETICGARFQRPGMPDRILSHARLGCWFVEFKTDKGRVKPVQRLVMEDMEYRGCSVLVAWHPPEGSAAGWLSAPDGVVVGDWDGTAAGLLAEMLLLKRAG